MSKLNTGLLVERISGQFRGQQIRITEAVATLGQQGTIQLSSSLIEPVHASINIGSDGSIFLADLSQSGIYVLYYDNFTGQPSWTKIPTGSTVPLTLGMRFALGLSGEEFLVKSYLKNSSLNSFRKMVNRKIVYSLLGILVIVFFFVFSSSSNTLFTNNVPANRMRDFEIKDIGTKFSKVQEEIRKHESKYYHDFTEQSLETYGDITKGGSPNSEFLLQYSGFVFQPNDKVYYVEGFRGLQRGYFNRIMIVNDDKIVATAILVPNSKYGFDGDRFIDKKFFRGDYPINEGGFLNDSLYSSAVEILRWDTNNGVQKLFLIPGLAGDDPANKWLTGSAIFSVGMIYDRYQPIKGMCGVSWRSLPEQTKGLTFVQRVGGGSYVYSSQNLDLSCLTNNIAYDKLSLSFQKNNVGLVEASVEFNKQSGSTVFSTIKRKYGRPIISWDKRVFWQSGATRISCYADIDNSCTRLAIQDMTWFKDEK